VSNDLLRRALPFIVDAAYEWQERPDHEIHQLLRDMEAALAAIRACKERGHEICPHPRLICSRCHARFAPDFLPDEIERQMRRIIREELAGAKTPLTRGQCGPG
jgi:hypothetical protein